MSYSDDDYACDDAHHYDDGDYGVANVKAGGGKKTKKNSNATPTVTKSNDKAQKTQQGGKDKDEALLNDNGVTPKTSQIPPPIEAQTTNNRQHTPADKVFARISWDTDGGFFIEDYDVGYEDRFVGLRFMKAERFRNDDKMETNKSRHRHESREGGEDGEDSVANRFRREPSASSTSSQSSEDSFGCADKFKVPKKGKLQETNIKRPKDYAPKNVKGSDIPFHRVRCFRRISDGLIVWDRESRVDLLDQLAAEYAAKVASGEIAPGRRVTSVTSTSPKPKSQPAVLPHSSGNNAGSASSLPFDKQELLLQLNDGFRVLKHLGTRPVEILGPIMREDGSRLSLPRPLLDACGPAADAILAAAGNTNNKSISSSPLKVLTYNVLHPFHKGDLIHSEARFGLIVDAIRRADADIITLQEVTVAFYRQLVGIKNGDEEESVASPSAAPLQTSKSSDALTYLQRTYYWTALPTFDEDGQSGRGGGNAKRTTPATSGVSSQIIGSRYPILGAGTYATSKMKRHVFATIADPLWYASLGDTDNADGQVQRPRPVPILAAAVHLVSDFAGPDVVAQRTQQLESLLHSLSAPLNAKGAALLPPFRCLIGADCNFGDQSEEMNRIQYLLSSSTTVNDSESASSVWWRQGAVASQLDAAPRAPHMYHDAWLRQFAITYNTTASQAPQPKSSSLKGSSSVNPFDVLKSDQVPLLAPQSPAPNKTGKGKAALDLSDATKAIAIQRTAAACEGKLSPIGGFTYDSRINHLAAIMTEKHFYPRRLDRIFFDETNFCLAGERLAASNFINDPQNVSVSLIGTEALPTATDPTLVLHPSDHFGVLANLCLRSYTYTPATGSTPTVNSSHGASLLASTTAKASSPPPNVKVHPNVIRTKVVSWEGPTDLDEDIDAHLIAWSERQQEVRELAEVRERIVNTLAKHTTQWAAVAALKAVKEQAAGISIDETARDFDLDSFRSEARRKYAARLFLTGSSAMGTHTNGSDIDALLVLPGAGRGYDEWFNELIGFLNGLMTKPNGLNSGEEDEDEEEEEEEVSILWLHSVVATPPTAKVPIVRLTCTDPDAEDSTKTMFEVEFGIAVLTGYDKVPPRQELVVAVGADDTQLGDEASTMLIRNCCRGDSRSVLSFDGLRSCSSIVDRYFCATDPSVVLVPAIRFIKCWAKARGVHGTSFG